MKNIVVFAGNDTKKDKEKYYFNLAYETGRLLAKSGFTTITGGGPGLMNEILRGAFENGGKTIGIRLLIEGRTHSTFVSEYILFKDLAPRQEKLLKMGDAFLALPGGIGTIYEIVAVLSHKRKGEILHTKPLILIDDYFLAFKRLMNKMVEEAFLNYDFGKYLQYSKSPQEAVASLNRLLKSQI